VGEYRPVNDIKEKINLVIIQTCMVFNFVNKTNHMEDQNQIKLNKATFKTNINCSGCVARVKVELDKVSGLTHWSVNTLSADKMLSVTMQGSAVDDVIRAVRTAGYHIEEIK
jgi:copper chaperone CopZ